MISAGLHIFILENNAALLPYEITIVATQEQKDAVLWVVVRHKIDYKFTAHLGDTILRKRGRELQ